MSVSNGSPIGVRWVSDNNNIFVNSLGRLDIFFYVKEYRSFFFLKGIIKTGCGWGGKGRIGIRGVLASF